MKYIIDIPNSFVDITNGLHIPIDKEENFRIDTGLKLIPYTEPDRKAIEDEVWELADYMCRMGVQERDSCFGFPLTTEVTANLSYQEAKSKFEAWLENENELHVGDEIVGIYSDGEKSPPLVVLKVEGNYYFGIYSKTGAFVQGGLNYEKTGRHFDEVETLLKKIRGEE